jgi:hypothetical protein
LEELADSGKELYSIFMCSNKCTFFIITPILVSIIEAHKTILNALIIDTKIGVLIKKVHLLEYIKIVNRNAR